MSIRIPRDEEHAPQVEKEAYWLPKLKPYLSLPIPAPLYDRPEVLINAGARF